VSTHFSPGSSAVVPVVSARWPVYLEPLLPFVVLIGHTRGEAGFSKAAAGDARSPRLSIDAGQKRKRPH